jgi:hypothetical protein
LPLRRPRRGCSLDGERKPERTRNPWFAARCIAPARAAGRNGAASPAHGRRIAGARTARRRRMRAARKARRCRVHGASVAPRRRIARASLSLRCGNRLQTRQPVKPVNASRQVSARDRANRASRPSAPSCTVPAAPPAAAAAPRARLPRSVPAPVRASPGHGSAPGARRPGASPAPGRQRRRPPIAISPAS